MEVGVIDRVTARILGTPRLMRLPIPVYRAGFGWIFGSRFAMLEHRGRVSGEPRFVVLEVIERTDRAIYVVSGFGTSSQWYRNLRANGVAYVSSGRDRRRRMAANLLDDARSADVLGRYAEAHPKAWKRLSSAMEIAQGGDPRAPVVEFMPHRG